MCISIMTKDQIKFLRKKNRLPFDGDFIWNITFTNILWSFLTWAAIALILQTFEVEKSIINLSFGLVLIAVSLKILNNNKLKFISNVQSLEENEKTIIETLNQLEWSFKKTNGLFEVRANRKVAWLTRIIISPSKNRIGYIFQYESGLNGSVMPFFIGIQSYLKLKFKKKLHTTIDILLSESVV